MSPPNDTATLADFQRNASDHVKRLKETGRPEVLTVDGKAEVVVLDAAAYQKLAEAAELAATLPVLRRSLEEADRNDGVPAHQVLAEMREKLGLRG